MIGAKGRVDNANRQAAATLGRRIASFGDVVGVNTNPATKRGCEYVKKIVVDEGPWDASADRTIGCYTR
ncbi:hypothetical protein OAS67_04390 [Alphaproteobacteria bacterium]|nr:hypothetical protein [Alphaproteobacteria bacterium]